MDNSEVSGILEGLETVQESRGRKPAVSPLLELDELALLAPTVSASSVPAGNTVAKLRERHHEIARLLALGTPAVEVHRITGMSQSHISRLQDDPAFGELLAFYRDKTNESFVDLAKRRHTLGLTAVDLLQERLEDPEKAAAISTDTLMKIADSNLPDVAKKQVPGPSQSNGAPSGPLLTVVFQSPPPVKENGLIIDGQVTVMEEEKNA